MPVFAPPGATVTIFATDRHFEVGLAYEVSFDSVVVPGGAIVAKNPAFIRAVVPQGVGIGPASVKVYRRERWLFGYINDYVVQHDDSIFTVLPPFVTVPPEDGVFESRYFDVAVDRQGTVLLPLDLTRVLDGTQFAFQFKDLRLAFGPGDVVFYSKDGVDLTLFTLAVDDSDKRQWGSYYGWEVDEDGDISGYRYQNRFARTRDLLTSSDILTYWRHEFRTYHTAHLPGRTHEVNELGFHSDGTRHVDHDFIVLAISGMQRHWLFPDNEFLDTYLHPGRARVRLNVAVVGAVMPVEPRIMIPLIEETRPSSLEDFIASHVPETVELP
jgi:hypothetical protein